MPQLIESGHMPSQTMTLTVPEAVFDQLAAQMRWPTSWCDRIANAGSRCFTSGGRVYQHYGLNWKR